MGNSDTLKEAAREKGLKVTLGTRSLEDSDRNKKLPKIISHYILCRESISGLGIGDQSCCKTFLTITEEGEIRSTGYFVLEF